MAAQRKVAVPPTVTPELRRYLEALQVRVDILDGERNAPRQRGVTVADLEDLGLVGVTIKRAQATMSLRDGVLGGSVRGGSALSSIPSAQPYTQLVGAQAFTADVELLLYYDGDNRYQRISVADFNLSLDHGGLGGLADNDHPQYPLKAGTETILGNWTFDATTPGTYSPVFNDYPQFNSGFEAKDYIEFRAEAGGADFLSMYWINMDGAADEKIWILESDAGDKTWSFRHCTDAYGSFKEFLKFHRVGNTVPRIEYGNATDNPIHDFNGDEINGRIGSYEWLAMESDGAAAVTGSFIDLKSDLYSEFLIRAYANVDYGPTMTFYKSRGTQAAPTQALANDFLGGFYWGARHDSAGWHFPVAMLFQLDANCTSGGGAPGWFSIWTGTTSASSVERLSFHTDGRVQLGVDTGLTFDEHASAPGTPASGKVVLYAKADGSLYQKDDAGLETLLAGGGGGNLDDLLDVDTTGLVVNDVLTWDGTNWIAIAPPGASGGEANTAANLGAGEGLHTAKVGVELRFKSLVAGTGISLSSSSTEVTITATGGGGGYPQQLGYSGI